MIDHPDFFGFDELEDKSAMVFPREEYAWWVRRLSGTLEDLDVDADAVATPEKPELFRRMRPPGPLLPISRSSTRRAGMN